MSGIYTKRGDSGQTGLLNGLRVPKDAVRVEAYGTFDEMGSVLGLARVHAICSPKLIRWLQERNFALCAELAGGDGASLAGAISEADTGAMEQEIDRIDALISRKPGFTLPGNNAASGFLHQARTIARRGERRMVSVDDGLAIRPELFAYVNRLSDLLYMLAREEEFVQSLFEQVKTALIKNEGVGMMKQNEAALYELADKLIAAAISKAKALGVPMVLAVVDMGGNLVAYRRMPGSLLASIDIAQGKAFTAAALRKTTAEVGQAVQPGAALYGLETTNGGRIVPFGGGYPLYCQGELIGGFGVSGGSVEEDMACAEYALAACKDS